MWNGHLQARFGHRATADALGPQLHLYFRVFARVVVNQVASLGIGFPANMTLIGSSLIVYAKMAPHVATFGRGHSAPRK